MREQEKVLIDNHGRRINYLRLAVTDRCNLRCFYCMPEEGIRYVPRTDLMTYEEMLRLITLLAKRGINKVRITGGEPFVRKGLPFFVQQINAIEGIQDIRITTNGTINSAQIKAFPEMGIRGVNLSLDTMDKERFHAITRRDQFDQVMESLDELVVSGVSVKINAVIMANHNLEDIIPLAELARNRVDEVRFIEEMPFNGMGAQPDKAIWNHKQIYAHLQEKYPEMEAEPHNFGDTSTRYKIPGFKGVVGIIAAYSRTFCGSCNRLRLTPTGVIKTCLYDAGVFNVRDLMRAGATDTQLITAIQEAVGNRAKDGFEAESFLRNSGGIHESMSTIGG